MPDQEKVYVKGQTDDLGNFFPDIPPNNTDLTMEQFGDFPGKFIVCDIHKNTILASGESEDLLAEGFKNRGLDPRKFGLQKIRE